MGTWSFRARKGGNYARTCARAPPLAAPVPGRARARDRVWVPYPLQFFLNRVTRIIPAPPPDPTRPAHRLSVNRRGSWAVEPNRCNGSDRTVATFRWVRTCWPLLERYIKRFHLSIETHQQKNSSLSLNVLNCKVSSELGSEVLK